ncbi:MAG TPA: hypothetical protein VFG04_15915 [Planctomycetaceae bacterium]|jgi:hypothetical protein|nr:hypothetical protein [Planctomycetaceae bacterium]
MLPPPRKVAALKRRKGEVVWKADPKVKDEYGDPAKPLGDPRDKPKRSTAPSLEETSEPSPPEQKPRKKKRKKSRDVPEPSGVRMFGFGFVGGSLGGVVWIAFAYFLKVHLGIIAILVGVLTGVGVQTGNSGADDHGPGEIAVFTAFAVILACKVVVACLLAGQFLGLEALLKTFTPYDFLWCAIAGRWAYRVASGALF